MSLIFEFGCHHCGCLFHTSYSRSKTGKITPSTEHFCASYKRRVTISVNSRVCYIFMFNIHSHVLTVTFVKHSIAVAMILMMDHVYFQHVNYIKGLYSQFLFKHNKMLFWFITKLQWIWKNIFTSITRY